jgi:hypothetical protein
MDWGRRLGGDNTSNKNTVKIGTMTIKRYIYIKKDINLKKRDEK